jgi:serine/threonine-protein kinase
VSIRKVCPQCGEEYDDAVGFCPKDGAALTAVGEGDLTGKLVGGRYRVLSRLGEGGMGQVYLAEHVRMKRKSAIKIMRPALVHEPESLQRFTREAENASKISHPNVAAIFDFGETDEGLVYLAMEYVSGESLAATLKREVALHPVVGADIIGQAADALQAAHDLGILHRDIKPDNVMVSKRTDGTFVVKLVDFGIARTMESGTQQVTRTGFAVGTPEYMSPEQLSGDVLDSRSDEYSLALVAFSALTGHDAFGNSSSKESLIARLTSRPRRLDEVRSDLEWPPSLQDVFDKSLAPDPSDRYPRVADFGNALADAVSEMTPTQTAEIYRHALGQRMSSTPVRGADLVNARTPAAGSSTQKTQAVKPAKRKDPVEFRRRPAILPWVFLAGLATYVTWWYGSQQPAGRAREAADKIQAAAIATRDKVNGWVNGPTGTTPADTTPVVAAPPAPAPKRARKKADTSSTAARRDTTADAKAASADTIKRDTTVPPPAY